MKFVKWFYEALGNNKGQRFRRLVLLVVIIGVIVVAVFNIGYEKSKGGLYWKPLDASFHKTIGN